VGVVIVVIPMVRMVILFFHVLVVAHDVDD
jgi:hypothetical protein